MIRNANSRKTVVYVGLTLLLLVASVSAIDPSDPIWINILIGGETPSFDSGEEVIVDFEINFTGPLLADTLINSSLNGVGVFRKLSYLLDAQGINYELEGERYQLLNSTIQADFPFSSAGEQIIYLKVFTQDDEFEDLNLNAIGSGPPYPTSPYLDFGNDGSIEWQYFGNHLGYLPNFVLPDNLNVNGPLIEIIVSDDSTNDRDYWCEEIDLPYTRHLQVHVNMEDLNAGGNMNVTLIQLETPGCQNDCDGFGQFQCNLPFSGNNTAQYYNCSLDMGYALQGDYLVCVYNTISGSGNIEQVKLIAESDSPQSAYRCELQSGTDYECEAFTVADFFIKVTGGNYSSILDTSADFMAGLVNNYEAFKGNVDDEIANCVNLSDGAGCAIPLRVGSLSGGVLSLQNLNMDFESSGAPLSTNNFYLGLVADVGIITDIGGLDILDISDGSTFQMNTLGLGLYAPSVSSVELFNLTLELVPGPQNSTEIEINPVTGEDNLTSSKQLISEYINFLTSQKTNYGDILDFLEFSNLVDSSLTSLNAVMAQANALNISNQSAISEFVDGLVENLDEIVEDVPSTINVISDVSEVILIQPSEILSEMVVGEEARLNAYYLQSDFTINGRARYVEVKLFDETEITGTIIDKSIIGQGTDIYVYELIPNQIISNPLTSITMEIGFELIKQSPSAVYRKAYQSIAGLSYSYFVQGNVVNGLAQMGTVLIPLSGVPEQIQETIPVCGDGKCAVLVIDGVKTYLEDAASCPEDCVKKVNWTGIFLVFFIGVLLIIAIALYFKFTRKASNVPTRPGMARAALFRNPGDEIQLRDYIADARVNKVDKEKTINTLLKKGWKQEQIDYVLKRLQQSRKK
tara:strand:+ start:4412 stop:6988 length:2577 start_codon:yes stop_codon:yes gene_type:complete